MGSIKIISVEEIRYYYHISSLCDSAGRMLTQKAGRRGFMMNRAAENVLPLPLHPNTSYRFVCFCCSPPLTPLLRSSSLIFNRWLDASVDTRGQAAKIKLNLLYFPLSRHAKLTWRYVGGRCCSVVESSLREQLHKSMESWIIAKRYKCYKCSLYTKRRQYTSKVEKLKQFV